MSAMLQRTCLTLLMFVTLTSTAFAQTVRVVNVADSALLILSPASCAAACPDSVRVDWRYGGQYITRKIRRTIVDTAKFARIPANSNFSDTARIDVAPLPTMRNGVSLAAFVTPIAVAAAPATPPAAPPAAAPTSSSATSTKPSGTSSGPPQANAPSSVAPAAPASTASPAAGGPPPLYVSTPITGSYLQPTAPATFSTAYPATSGKVRRVTAGQDLQDVLNAAQPGDEIVLANGATFTGNFILPQKSGAGWIVIRGEAPIGAQGTRIDPKTLAPAAAVVTNNSMPAIRTANGAARWRLVGFQISHASGAAYNYGIVVLGVGDEQSLSLMPSDIVLDRMWVHGSTTDGTSRCVAFNGIRLAVIQSWLTECHAKGFDAQGVGGWGGPGPFLIENNRIEASGQAVMFGGADPRITDVLPSDIIVRRNYFFRPTSWARGKWSVKAAFELKNGKRVQFEGNVIENSWADAQTGFAILFQTLADNNRSWNWTTVQDVLVQNNIIRNSTSGVTVVARVAYNGGTLPTNPTSRVAVVNNLFENVGVDPITRQPGIIVQLLGDLNDVTFAQNTITLPSGRAQKAVSLDGRPARRTTISDNIFPSVDYAVTGNATPAGTATINAFMPGGVFRNNVMPGQSPNIFARGAITSSARGANIAAINNATAGVAK